MQGTDLVTVVRDMLGDDAYDSSAILRAGNWFVYELANKHRLRMYEESDTISAAAGDTTADFPSDMQRMLELTLTSPMVYDLKKKYVEYGDFMRFYPRYATNAPTPLNHWTDFGNAMRFSAPLSAAHTMAIDYIRRPDTCETTDDSFDIPSPYYDEMMTKGALVRIMEMDEDYDVSANERALLANLVNDFVKNEGRGGIKAGPTVMRTNRRTRRAY